MRSLIIFEVEHGESTDPLDSFAGLVSQTFEGTEPQGFNITDYTVRVDVPNCFKL